jgi:hypothetical protein
MTSFARPNLGPSLCRPLKPKPCIFNPGIPRANRPTSSNAQQRMLASQCLQQLQLLHFKPWHPPIHHAESQRMPARHDLPISPPFLSANASRTMSQTSVQGACLCLWLTVYQQPEGTSVRYRQERLWQMIQEHVTYLICFVWSAHVKTTLTASLTQPHHSATHRKCT